MSISVRNLCFSYPDHPVLKDLSFEAPDGVLVAVLGPNGVGKTTLLRCILGLENHYQGQIMVQGEDVKDLPARQLARRIAYIPQVHGNAFGYSVMDMVLMGTSPMMSPAAVPHQKQIDAAMTAMKSVGIENLKNRSFVHLSGGEQQLVLIARALAQNAKVLLMDEPTSSLDFGNQAMVLNQARSLARGGYTVLMSTHNPQHALWYADYALALEGGEVVGFGQTDKILDADLISRLYKMRVSMVSSRSGMLICPEESL
ncbi:MAG: ABC transporter ATP-binding protein [Sphaerochaetaceae bacterium]|jgi:iron complex transport system ATP-binding protein|nr:ABC transporter ATP-binding protein [Sphaerochaetaceae bacterium]MDD3163618.1 ABC transporter ATP-binding protein [Sphaerochaetaceae bacterium]MDD4007849.1 ABC transporter ATP-binding protein [Sphaerochaetaceae bacterium]MDD4396976.1 ABC transporter ATP-binding protein [Sphaerochaetaceae bacterium]